MNAPHTPRFINGSILSRFSRLELSSADGRVYDLRTTPFRRLAIRLIGLPHLGFRARANFVLSAVRRLPRGRRVLDAGCGYGIYAMSLAEEGYRVDAIDLDEKRIAVLNRMRGEYAALKDTLALHTGSLTALPYAADTFDGIICSEVIEHVTDDAAAIAELSRVLKPGGTLILSVPYDSKHNQKLYKRFEHERPGYTREKIGRLLAERGLSVQKVSYYEHAVGRVLFDTFITIRSMPLMGLLFYPFYGLYVLDQYCGLGEPNQMVVIAKKTV